MTRKTLMIYSLNCNFVNLLLLLLSTCKKYYTVQVKISINKQAVMQTLVNNWRQNNNYTSQPKIKACID